MQLYSSHGANVIFGDVDTARGTALANSLPSNTHFVRTDVTQYDSLLSLFEKAYELYSRVDIAISNAGLIEIPGWFDPSLDLTTIKKAPTTRVQDVNLTGTLFFSHIAAVYLRQSAGSGDDKSLILLSSVAGFEESPGLFVYQATKHGVIGLMRSLRCYFPSAYGDVRIRVNCVCPWATKTAMTTTFQDSWEKEGLPLNSPEHLGEIILGVSVDSTLNGETVYVEGGKGWAIEEKLKETKPQWLGESAHENLLKGQAFLGTVSKSKNSFNSRF